MPRSPTELAELIIQRANGGYHDREDYPPFALTPWDDRLRWSDYIKVIAAEVLVEEERSK